MTQPSLTTTFDTSLIDLSPPSSVPVSGLARVDGSFSTVETEVSDDAGVSQHEEPQEQEQEQHRQQGIGLGVSGIADVRIGDGDDGEKMGSEDEDEEDDGNDGNASADISAEAKGESNHDAVEIAAVLASAPSRAATHKKPLGSRTNVPQKHSRPRKSSCSSSSPTITPRAKQLRHDPGNSKTTEADRKKPALRMPTESAYDVWAPTYDTDGNFLQAVDDAELQSLLPRFLARTLACYEAGRSSTSTSTSTDNVERTKSSSEPAMQRKRKREDHDRHSEKPTLRIVDLGCGTGRNTVKMLAHPWPADLRVRIVGLDFSGEMLDVARRKCERLKTARKEMRGKGCSVGFKTDKNADASANTDVNVNIDADVDIELCRWDFSSMKTATPAAAVAAVAQTQTLSPEPNSSTSTQPNQPFPAPSSRKNHHTSNPTPPQTPSPSINFASSPGPLSPPGPLNPPNPAAEAAHAVLSTLVAEHIPLPTFFQALRLCVRVGGIALLTNMHSDMGRDAQAGFVDAKGNKVLSGKSWIHGVDETVEEARRAGFEVLEDDKVGGEEEERKWAESGREVRGKGKTPEGEGRADAAKGSSGKRRELRGVREVRVEEDMVEWLGGRSRKWIGMKVWFGMMLRRVS